jgi:hypothetical protein
MPSIKSILVTVALVVVALIVYDRFVKGRV